MFNSTSLSSEDRGLLYDSYIFKDLPENEMKTVMKECRVKEYEPGQNIVTEGDIGRGVFILLEGQAEVFLPKKKATGVVRPTPVILAHLKPGQCFGEYSLIDDREVSASVRAVSKAKLCYLSHMDFNTIAEADNRVGKIMYRNLLTVLVERLRKMDKDLDIAFLPFA